MKKTMLSLIAITALATAGHNSHAMIIIGPNATEVPVGTQDTGVQGSDLIIAQEGVSGAHDHVYTVDMSGLVTDQGTQNTNDISKNSQWADQIDNGVVNGSILSINERSQTGGSIKSTDIDMSGLITNQGTSNAQAIVNETTRAIAAETALDTRVTTNESDIQTNANEISNNTNNITTNANNITQNRTDITTNANNITDNSNTITHNAGGVVNGTTIKSNKQLTVKTEENWQNIQINAGNIAYNYSTNIAQQNQIDDLYGRTDDLQSQILGINGQMDGLAEFMGDSAAGSMAVATIDFGTVHTDELEIGVGVGMSGGDYIDTSFAGGIGAKYGITETTSAIGKVWMSNHGNYGAGAGVVFKY